MQRFWRTLCSPLGCLRLIARDDGALIRIELEREPTAEAEHDDGRGAAAAQQLREFFAGARRDFDLQLAPIGSPFQLLAWQALRTIPFGATRSHSQQAASIGRPAAVRAIGAANGSNPLPIVVPCHRVLGKDGSLVGFAGGLDRKRWLLDHEARLLTGKAQLSFA